MAPDARLDIAGAVNALFAVLDRIEARLDAMETRETRMVGLSELANMQGISLNTIHVQPWRLPGFGTKAQKRKPMLFLRKDVDEWLTRPLDERRVEWQAMTMDERKAIRLGTEA